MMKYKQIKMPAINGGKESLGVALFRLMAGKCEKCFV